VCHGTRMTVEFVSKIKLLPAFSVYVIKEGKAGPAYLCVLRRMCMNHIGMRIKTLRKQKDMTQEKMAEYLGVSFQAVSKWETGAASPDLAMIVPLARLLGVSTDALFGLEEKIEDAHQKELGEKLTECWRTGELEKRFEIAKTAVREYPGNLTYRYWLGDAEWSYAIAHCEKGSLEQTAHFDNAVHSFEMVIEDAEDSDLKNAGLVGIVYALSSLDKREEALIYARQHPNSDNLMKCCLRGEAWEHHRQEMIFKHLNNLVAELECGKHDLNAIQAAEKIIKTVIDDENYLWFHDDLMHNYIWQAQCLTRQKRYEEAVACLEKSYEQAVLYEKVAASSKEKPIPYTSPVLNRLSFDVNDLMISGTTTLIEDFKTFLSQKDFDSLRDREDFRELLNL